jgi:TonB-linked SusC/RagA family outer membrane protein
LYGILLALAVVAAPVESQTENAVITGRITSEFGRPIDYANVTITELGISARTNAQGVYTINVPAARVSGQEAVLRARAIGYSPETRTVRITAGSQTFDFQLRPDVTRLSEVVVTGVAEGTERAKLPFTVSRVDAEDLPAPSMNPLSAIQGRVAGANIVQASGRPGTAPEVLLRAPTSINALGRGQQPLYVVDGIVLAAGLPDINPSDIASVEVVKGAAAASLYGARAGNGVIQITTKRGESLGSESMRFGLRAEYGISDIEREFGLAENHRWLMNDAGDAFCADVDCLETFDWVDEVLRINSNTGARPLVPDFSPVASGTTAWNTFQNQRWPGPTFNAIDQVVDPGAFAQTDLSMSGRFGRTNFFASLGHLLQQGSMIGLEGYQRTSGRVNLDQTIGDAWTVQMSTFYSRSKDDGAGQEGASFFDLTRVPRGVNILMKDSVRGEYIIRPDLQAENENPAYALTYQDRLDQADRFLGGLDVRYTPLGWLDFRASASYDRRNNRFTQFNDKNFRTTRSSPLNLGQVFKASSFDQSMNGSLSGTVRGNLLEDLTSSLQLRVAYEQQDGENANLTGRDLAVSGVADADNARAPQIFVTSGENSIRRLGFFLNGVLDFRDRYYVDALIRRDGSSLFGAENRWQTFGRLGVSWRASEEPWFTIPAVDELKLRYAIGTAGNSPNFAAQYEVYDLEGGTFVYDQLGNKNLGPELLTEQEFGVDFALFGRMAATLSYSTVVTKDQILQVPLVAAAGFRTQWENAGTMEGNTFEASLDIPWVQRADLNVSTRFNFDRSRATITQLDVPPYQYGVGLQELEVAFFAREGERYGTIYGTRFARNCGDLPSGVDCGQFRANDQGYFVWTGGADPGSGATRNPNGSIAVAPGTWGTEGPILPGRITPVRWGAPLIAEDDEGETYLPLGNTLPDYRWSFAPNVTYKRLTATALVDASIGRSVYNQGRHWSYFENYSKDQDQQGKPNSAIKPTGYYLGLYNVLQPNSHFVEDGSFTKLREMTLSYRVGTLGLNMGDWTMSLVGRNLKTWTDYSGFDPEVGIAGTDAVGGEAASGVISAFDSFRFPPLRTFTFALQANF